jgi:hypothetical protein
MDVSISLTVLHFLVSHEIVRCSLLVGNIGNLVGSFAWKADWGPGYHPSMWISLASLLFASFLAFGTSISPSQLQTLFIHIFRVGSVIRSLLVRENREADKRELDLKGAGRQRIEEAARLEGITFEEAVERKKGFRYLV